MTIKENEIDIVKQQLLELAQQPNNNSKTDIIKSLRKEIRAARKAGKTWQQIATIFNDAGISVAATTVQYATQPARKKTGDNKRATKNAGKKTAEKQTAGDVAQPPLRPGQFEIKPDREEL